MSLADNPAAVAAAIKARDEGVIKYTMMDVRQGPGEGNYDRIQELKMKDALRAAEAVGELDEQDTLVMQEVGEDEGD